MRIIFSAANVQLRSHHLQTLQISSALDLLCLLPLFLNHHLSNLVGRGLAWPRDVPEVGYQIIGCGINSSFKVLGSRF